MPHQHKERPNRIKAHPARLVDLPRHGNVSATYDRGSAGRGRRPRGCVYRTTRRSNTVGATRNNDLLLSRRFPKRRSSCFARSSGAPFTCRQGPAKRSGDSVRHGRLALSAGPAAGGRRRRPAAGRSIWRCPHGKGGCGRDWRTRRNFDGCRWARDARRSWFARILRVGNGVGGKGIRGGEGSARQGSRHHWQERRVTGKSSTTPGFYILIAPRAASLFPLFLFLCVCFCDYNSVSCARFFVSCLCWRLVVLRDR